MFDDYLQEKADRAIRRCNEHIQDITSSLMWDLSSELLNGAISLGMKQPKENSKNKIRALERIRKVLKDIVPEEKITNNLVEELYNCVKGGILSKTFESFQEQFSKFSTSMEVQKSQEDAVREFIEEQFRSLKVLITIEIILTIETNITGEFDSKTSGDKTLHSYLVDHIVPKIQSKDINLEDMRRKLEEKVNFLKTEREQLQDLLDISGEIATAITNGVIPFNVQFPNT